MNLRVRVCRRESAADDPLKVLVGTAILLVGLAGVDFGEHQRFALKWAAAICVLMTLAAFATEALPAIAS